MGVDRTDYIIYGWKLPFELENNKGKISIWDDKFLPFIEGRSGVEYSFIYDGMCNEYIVFGKSILSGGDKYEGWGFNDISIGEMDPENLKNKFRELFEMEPPSEPKLFIFSHFS